ncbi:MAG: hypothetical protein II919_04365 [Lachnospiraceae bacterium]|nr:hypothetical protein [Lachnospiraceae bacterium]
MEFDLMAKDYIKFYLLNEVVNRKVVKFHLYLESEGIERDFLDIKTDKAVYRFNNFNVSEDGTNDCITFRPIVVGCYSYFEIEGQFPVKVEIIRNGTSTVEQTITLLPGKTKIVFEPDGIKKYRLIIEQTIPTAQNMPMQNTTAQNMPMQNMAVQNMPMQNMPAQNMPMQNMTAQNAPMQNMTVQSMPMQNTTAQNVHMRQDYLHNLENERRNLILGNDRISEEINKINEDIIQIEEKKKQLTENRNHLQIHMENLKNEYEKDYSKFESDAEDIRARYLVDEELIRMYAGKEVKPIEELLVQAENLLENIEQQIKNFVTVQEKKTTEIEDELKIGKKG